MKCELNGEKWGEANNCELNETMNNLDQRCKEEFIKGCKLSKVKKFCKMGADMFLKSQETTCKLESNFASEYEKKYYNICCETCREALNKSPYDDECKTIALDSDKPEYYIQEEYERCCEYSRPKSNKCHNSNCEQICGNNFSDENECSCEKGYILNKNGYSCDDINECETINPCSGLGGDCVNTKGSYGCFYPDRFGRSEEVTTEPNKEDITDEIDIGSGEDNNTNHNDNFEKEISNAKAVNLPSKSSLLNPQISLYFLVSISNILLLTRLI